MYAQYMTFINFADLLCLHACLLTEEWRQQFSLHDARTTSYWNGAAAKGLLTYRLLFWLCGFILLQ